MIQILESKSVFVCEMPLNNGFKLHLYSVSNFFVEELVNSKGEILEIKPVSTAYVASLYCKNFDLSKQLV
ncbi:MAG: hypothetical protein JNM67_07535 [Bacteroidetes bacterium]|nr:hypothetical protein [Bacteroidota bacterium]